MTDYRIEYLADYPEHTEACAAWGYGRWGVQNPDNSLQKALDRFKEGQQKKAIPLTVIAINEENNCPIAMGELREEDGTHWDKLYNPWIASVFTLYRYRNLGISTAIIQRLETEAKRLGFPAVYLHSGSAAGFYTKQNYEQLDEQKTNLTAAGKQVLFRKTLNSL